MTNTVIIYGRSDDLIAVTGAISTEFALPVEDTGVIAFDDGRRFRLTYDGDWHVECLNESEDLRPVDYSEVAVYDVGHLPVFCDYSEVAVYRSWAGVSRVEMEETNE